MICQHCEEHFDIGCYFWDHLGEPVRCPHCNKWSGTDWEESYDSAEAWTTSALPPPTMEVTDETRWTDGTLMALTKTYRWETGEKATESLT